MSAELNVTVVLDCLLFHIHQTPCCQRLENRNSYNRISVLCFCFPSFQFTGSLHSSFFPPPFSFVLLSVISVQLQLCSGGGTQPFSREATSVVGGVADACPECGTAATRAAGQRVSPAGELLPPGVPSSDTLRGLRCLAAGVPGLFCDDKLKLNDFFSITME